MAMDRIVVLREALSRNAAWETRWRSFLKTASPEEIEEAEVLLQQEMDNVELPRIPVSCRNPVPAHCPYCRRLLGPWSPFEETGDEALVEIMGQTELVSVHISTTRCACGALHAIESR